MPNAAQNQKNRDIFADNLNRLMARQDISDKELCDQINQRFGRNMASGTMKLYREKKQPPEPEEPKIYRRHARQERRIHAHRPSAADAAKAEDKKEKSKDTAENDGKI